MIKKRWIKRTLSIMGLMLAITTSLTAGTLAMYTTSIDNMADGSVTAKEFIFLEDGVDTFSQGIKIAPSETVMWQFQVKNYDDAVVTETDLYYKLTFNVMVLEGKTAIEPLTVKVLDDKRHMVGSAAGTGTFDVLGAFPLSQLGQSAGYTVIIDWPSHDGIDIMYAGEQFGTRVTVDAVASQVPFEGSQQPHLPTGKVSVKYETTQAWSNHGGPLEYAYRVTISNNGDQAIEDWYISFRLDSDTLTRAWSNAIMTNEAVGGYRFVNPAYNNKHTDHILPGQSVTFSGPALGTGTHGIYSAIVGGSNTGAVSAGVSNEFGVKLN